MARQLWLLRHADAEPHGTRVDSERRLTERGERQARLAGAAIARMGVEFEAFLTSPKERALRTAQVAAHAWTKTQRGRLVVHPPLAGGFDSRQALELVRAPAADASPSARGATRQREAAGAARQREAARRGADVRVLLVGHEPDFSTVVAELTGARIDLKKGGLAVVRIEGAGGELVALLRPSELALLAEGWSPTTAIAGSR